MKKRFVKSQNEPKMITIQGEEYPALFSMAAMAEVEELSGLPYGVYFNKLAANETRLKDQLFLVVACLHGGGTEVTLEDLMESLDFAHDFPAVLSQVIEMATIQAPEGDENAKKPK